MIFKQLGVRPVISKSISNSSKTLDTSKPNKPSDEKREHAIWDDNGLISVAGGKLTTYRLIALDTLQKAAPYLSMPSASFETTSHFEPMPKMPSLMALSSESKKRLLGRYGKHAQALVSLSNNESKNHVTKVESSGIAGVGSSLSKIATTDTLWAELIWACQSESVQHLDDLLLRRTRIGLLMGKAVVNIFEQVKQICQQHLNWDDLKWQSERLRYQDIIDRHYFLPK